MVDLPVEQDDCCLLLRLDRVPEDHLPELDPGIPLTASLVALWDVGECLLLFNRSRQPISSVVGAPRGDDRSGESARQAARRELVEESGQQPGDLAFAGVAQVWYSPAERLEYSRSIRGRWRLDRPSSRTPR